jgi:hypothetical protein
VDSQQMAVKRSFVPNTPKQPDVHMGHAQEVFSNRRLKV